jgi:glycerol-3-phosphate dehydrogenase
MAREWAMSAEDVLWRRTKCGLKLAAQEIGATEAYIAANKRGTIAAE